MKGYDWGRQKPTTFNPLSLFGPTLDHSKCFILFQTVLFKLSGAMSQYVFALNMSIEQGLKDRWVFGFHRVYPCWKWGSNEQSTGRSLSQFVIVLRTALASKLSRLIRRAPSTDQAASLRTLSHTHTNHRAENKEYGPHEAHASGGFFTFSAHSKNLSICSA